MDFAPLLTPRKCSCGRTHSCDIRSIVIGPGAIRQLGDLTAAYQSILLVADGNTYAACGPLVEYRLAGRLGGKLVYSGDELLIPSEEAIARLENSLAPSTDLILGVGSGVIQDLCKYVSFQKGLPYHIVATAPSMDGYASTGAAMILGGMKVTVSTHVPEVIVGDTDVLREAPLEMIQSGYGDILGKFSCLNDWKLSHVVREEYFCQEIHDLMADMLDAVKDLGPALLRREEAAICLLMEALVGAGVAMALVGNSRPASGSEHHLSHYFEITGILNREPYFLHGTDVAYASVYTQRLRERLLELDRPPSARNFDPLAWEADIRRIYTAAAGGITALQDRLGWYREDRSPVYREKWNAIRKVLSDAPSARRMEEYLHSIGLNLEDFETLYGETRISDGLRYAKDLKDRFSVLWVYWDILNP